MIMSEISRSNRQFEHWMQEIRENVEDDSYMTKTFELELIDRVLSRTLDALESDSNIDARREAFEMIQDLYEPDRLIGWYANIKREDELEEMERSRNE